MFTVNFIFYSKHLFIFGHFVGVDSGQPCSWLDGNWRHRRHLLAPGPQEACNVLYLNNLFFLLAWRYVLVSLRNSLSQLILPQVCCQSHRRPLLGDVVRSWCNKCHPCQRWSQQSFAYIYSLLAKRWLFWRGFNWSIWSDAITCESPDISRIFVWKSDIFQLRRRFCLGSSLLIQTFCAIIFMSYTCSE